jgi:hypothetical protein
LFKKQEGIDGRQRKIEAGSKLQTLENIASFKKRHRVNIGLTREEQS